MVASRALERPVAVMMPRLLNSNQVRVFGCVRAAAAPGKDRWDREEGRNERKDHAHHDGHVSAAECKAENGDEASEHRRLRDVDACRNFETLILTGALDRCADNFVLSEKLSSRLATCHFLPTPVEVLRALQMTARPSTSLYVIYRNCCCWGGEGGAQGFGEDLSSKLWRHVRAVAAPRVGSSQVVAA